MHGLTGYTDRWSVKQGAAIRFHVSSAGGAPFELRFVRHTCPDPNPRGPGYAEIAMASPLDGRQEGREQPAWLGSFGHVPALLVPAGGLTLRATVWPTTPAKGRQGIVAVRLGDWCLSLGIGEGGGAMLAVEGGGRAVRAEVSRPLRERRWYDIEGRLDGEGRLSVRQVPRQPLGDEGDAQAAGAAPCPGGVASVYLAALPPDGGGAPASGHYNGKLEAPSVWQGMAGAVPHATAPLVSVPLVSMPGLVAAWDFSRGIPTQVASEVGAQAAHAALVNLPARAMTGAGWNGAVHDWKTDPSQYGAIHFHDDDQGDLGWQESFCLAVPEDWPSGFYAAHIRNEACEDYIPFFVRPAKPSADVAFLVPTFSYQVYGCYVRPGRGAEIAERARDWRALTETPDMNPEFGLSCYNYHSDGSGVSLVSMLRPQLDTRPRQISLMDPVEGGSGTGRIGADGYFIHWLTQEGIAHDVITDHDLHEEGAAALAPYRVVIAGQHPEYHSERMMQGFEDFLAGGGRLMYLGGNGFYWRAEPSKFAPHAMEVRRAESGIRVWATEPGESYNQFGGGYGGLWRRVGRSGHKLVGINFSSQGRHLGFPYHFTSGINDPRAAFMTAGLNAAEGAAFGDSGFMGGGAAGFELDSVNFKYGSPPHVLVVAKGVVVHPDYGWVNEDMLVHRHPLPAEEWSCADMTFFETPAGGAVFSAGSMTYAGSVAVPGTLRQLTTNVLRRFMDPVPFVLPE